MKKIFLALLLAIGMVLTLSPAPAQAAPRWVASQTDVQPKGFVNPALYVRESTGFSPYGKSGLQVPRINLDTTHGTCDYAHRGNVFGRFTVVIENGKGTIMSYYTWAATARCHVVHYPAWQFYGSGKLKITWAVPLLVDQGKQPMMSGTYCVRKGDSRKVAC